MNNNNVKFTVEVEMPERWVDHFLSFLNYMESCGRIGHSTSVAFFADGGGDFRPKFTPSIQYNRVPDRTHGMGRMVECGVFYDAG